MYKAHKRTMLRFPSFKLLSNEELEIENTVVLLGVDCVCVEWGLVLVKYQGERKELLVPKRYC